MESIRGLGSETPDCGLTLGNNKSWLIPPKYTPKRGTFLQLIEARHLHKLLIKEIFKEILVMP